MIRGENTKNSRGKESVCLVTRKVNWKDLCNTIDIVMHWTPTKAIKQYYYYTTQRTHTQSKNYCVAQGKIFAVIDDAIDNEEAAFTANEAQAWIGATDASGSWKWITDGSTVSFTKWGTHQPDNSGDCAVTNWVDAGVWDDQHGKKRFLPATLNLSKILPIQHCLKMTP